MLRTCVMNQHGRCEEHGGRMTPRGDEQNLCCETWYKASKNAKACLRTECSENKALVISSEQWQVNPEFSAASDAGELEKLYLSPGLVKRFKRLPGPNDVLCPDCAKFAAGQINAHTDHVGRAKFKDINRYLPVFVNLSQRAAVEAADRASRIVRLVDKIVAGERVQFSGRRGYGETLELQCLTHGHFGSASCPTGGLPAPEMKAMVRGEGAKLQIFSFCQDCAKVILDKRPNITLKNARDAWSELEVERLAAQTPDDEDMDLGGQNVVPVNEAPKRKVKKLGSAARRHKRSDSDEAPDGAASEQPKKLSKAERKAAAQATGN